MILFYSIKILRRMASDLNKDQDQLAATLDSAVMVLLLLIDKVYQGDDLKRVWSH